MNNRHWFSRNTVRTAMIALLLAAASGCGSSADGAQNEDPRTPIEVMPEVPQTPETNALGETLCGVQDFGIDQEDGRRYVQQEIYNFDKINEEIARYPELVEATGFSEVTDCDGARAYGDGYRAFAEAHPNFRQETSKEEMFAEYLSDPANVGEPDPEGPEVEKIFGGSIGDRPAVVKTARQVGPNQYAFCSAVRISKSLFLTAAHCLPNPTSSNVQSFQIFMKRRKSNGVEGWLGGQNGKPLNIYAIPYPGYTGFTSADFDFAVFWVLKQHHTLLNAEPEFSATTLLAPRTPAASDGQLVYGWGLENLNEAFINTRLRTPAPQPTLYGINSVGSEAWSIPDPGPQFRMCQGDSGGPALRDGMVDGITSLVLPHTGTFCSDTGRTQYWTRVDKKVQWLRQQMAILQKGSTKTPFMCVFHSGNPSDPTDWEHIISYIDCNEI
jgi:hypothetical protein